jgi:hypothetical protein
MTCLSYLVGLWSLDIIPNQLSEDVPALYSSATTIRKLLRAFYSLINMSSNTWQDIAKIGPELRDKSIAEVKPIVPDVPSELPSDVSKLPSDLLSEAEISITESKPEQLLDALARRSCYPSTHQRGGDKCVPSTSWTGAKAGERASYMYLKPL